MFLPSRRSRNSSPTKIGPIHRPTLVDAAPMLSASSSNNHSLFSFGGRNGIPDDLNDPAASFDFLPSVSFDDLQSSLESASTDFKLTQFPSPTGQGTILGGASSALAAHSMVEQRADMTRNATGNHAPVQQIPPVTRSRTGSILRRPSNASSRQPSLTSASTAAMSANPGVPNAPTAPAAMRAGRRQSHYPPVSNATVIKPPRKSTGDVGLGTDFEPRKRRPSVTSLSDRNGLGEPSVRSSVDGGSRPTGDFLRAHANSRSSKARSVQPPPRASQAMLTPDTSSLSLDHTHISMALPRSPRAAAKTCNPSLGKRVSVMPGVPQLPHATGLGARTISPTDTRRLKRLSMHHTQGQSPAPPILPNPPPLSVDVRSSSRSPSMLPRKITTPSSSRTTPDLARKSYSSGLSITSNASFSTTIRTSTASVQQRNSQMLTSSRLPAPKALSLHSSASMEDTGDVPPVPAIPKAYESPKDTLAEAAFLDKRRSNLAFDASSIHSNSTGSMTGALNDSTPAKLQRRPSQRKTVHAPKLDLGTKPAAPHQPKKTLQPLRLPPITLGPLSTPTAAKIAALQEQGHSDRNLSPPPARQIAKTPTTPMTASKGTFFSRTRPEERTDIQHLRSSSSVHRFRRESPPPPEPASSAESFIAVKDASQRHGPSPFLSSSLPKGGNLEAAFLKRSKTGGGGDFTVPLDAAVDSPLHYTKPSGPRAPKPAATRPAKSPPPLSSPEEPPTPSSMSSLRRKLSLSWKRSASKNSGSQPQGEKNEHKTVKHDSMPPPRIPASATANSIPAAKPPSPAPSAKSSGNGTYLESRRRKSSASSLNAIINQDQRGRTDGLNAAKKESTLGTVSERTTLPHNSSVVQKILKPRHSVAALRHHDVWTADLDNYDLVAEEEMKKLGMRRKDTELAARTLDALRKRASAKERVSPQEAIRIAVLNIYERGEIVDYKDVYFCGTQNAAKVVGDPQSDSPNFGYDDERGDYSIVPGDHLSYRYEIIDVLGKGSFGQVVRCIDHKTGVLVAVKIIRNKKRFHQQALVEVNILQKLREWVSVPAQVV